jgi:predicted SAM-dependent methyltransferase/Zn-finger nucleic acid-binding protein
MICPVCTTPLVAHRIGRVHMLRCPSCTVVVRHPSLALDKGAAYYETEYRLTHTVRASTEMHRYFRYPEYQRLIGDVLHVHPDAASWLDVGCDHGFFLDDVRRYGLDVCGVEPSHYARTYAQRIGLDVHRDLADVQATYDVISMWHVLEHIEDPHAMLSTLRDRLAPSGVLAVRVPDAASFWSRVLKDRWIWFQPEHHAVHYSERSLRHLLESVGFTVTMLRRQRPNNSFTRRAYHLSRAVMRRSFGTAATSMRDVLARTYQDITGQELYAIARLDHVPSPSEETQV